jgi:hypothetical protein
MGQTPITILGFLKDGEFFLPADSASQHGLGSVKSITVEECGMVYFKSYFGCGTSIVQIMYILSIFEA